jgi:signal transduction histidine kinase/CheY-like chemotaxis protein/HPt (histidine-containing phosphotransfer) domain-containing protein
MNQPTDISWHSLHALFSVVMCIDESMSIIHASETLCKFLPATAENPRVDEIFKVLRPSSFNTFKEATSTANSLCLMTANSGQFAIRGQLVPTLYDNRNVLCFCGAPWLFWINNNCPDIHLSLNDFSTQDVQLDQLFFMSTEKRMVEDLEQLATDLQKTKSDLEAAQAAQSDFFAQMSHELRTPLNGVVSAVSLLEKLPLGNQQAELVAFAKSSSENLMQVINYVLDVSKLEQIDDGDQDEFNFPALLRSAFNVIQAKANAKSLQLELDISADVPQQILGHANPLRQVLLNLLINAIKYTAEGSVTLHVCQVARTENEYRLRFEVIDTGTGISQQHHQRIFEPFFSLAPGVSTGNESSTGLGLDIVRRNVELMGGELGLVSSPGQGSTFWFELPMTATQDKETTATIDNAPAEKSGGEASLSGCVLLVDDNQTNLLLGSMILESLGMNVIKACNGMEGVAAARQHQPDLVLMDISMPDISGLEATRQIREFVDADSLPIVALTAHVDSREKKSCLDIGMNGYLTKPIVREALFEELARWLHSDKPAAPALVDEAVLQDLIRQIGQDNLRTVIDKVQTEAQQRWEELSEAAGNGDVATAQRHAHSLGSIFRSVGLMRAGDAFAAIEATLRAGDQLAADCLPTLAPLKDDSILALGRYMVAL